MFLGVGPASKSAVLPPVTRMAIGERGPGQVVRHVDRLGCPLRGLGPLEHDEAPGWRLIELPATCTAAGIRSATPAGIGRPE
jgi:hypothetical protein